jgi:hypothetical protein
MGSLQFNEVYQSRVVRLKVAGVGQACQAEGVLSLPSLMSKITQYIE